MARNRTTTALAATALAGLVALTGCTASSPTGPKTPSAARTVLTAPTDALTVADGDAAANALVASRQLFGEASVVVVAASDDADAQGAGAAAAEKLGVPMLLGAASRDPESTSSASSEEGSDEDGSDEQQANAVDDELDRLKAHTVVTYGEVNPHQLDVPGEGSDGGSGAERRIVAGSADSDDDVPRLERGEPAGKTLALATDDPSALAAAATARAAGVPVHAVPAANANPQASADAITALAAAPDDAVLALGAPFADQQALDWKVRSARTGYQLPGGGQILFPGHQFVALYGAIGTGALGVLGEQDAAATVQRAKDVAAPYESLSDKTVVPLMEIIATVAAGAAGPDGDYSNEIDPETIRPWIQAAADAGQYVVLDLQPGRSDFLSQAKRYQSLLELPNVGLALDPEWRLKPDQVPLRQIGSVSAAEVNEVSAWLAQLTNEKGLPPKMFVLHQFRLAMIQDRQTLDMSHPELAMLIHADGQGGQPDKQATWRALHQGAPEGMAWGWKNFYDEDKPMLTPDQTMRDVAPLPDLVTYQ
ncbi:hypothetical protein ALI44B_10280 [Leifsonia sp. ALI-44-B]|uniref:hypothetical protein n=1 Tax=Leifsonia sp. ALI-44-B TaxID=1933776 RepID=UPI00097CA967|nr:hypothetical protein [Leifsonia sp. ALI-44-B]ONI60919.1 hypothetical protein ALI44B_10280 [Leifsonia sp. ALI-44-B]